MFPFFSKAAPEANSVPLQSGIIGIVPLTSQRNTRVASVRAAMEELVKIFKKSQSRFYCDASSRNCEQVFSPADLSDHLSWHCQAQEVPGLSSRFLCSRFADRRYKPISLPTDGFNESRLFMVVLKDLPDLEQRIGLGACPQPCTPRTYHRRLHVQRLDSG
jgi:hypothetical protein